MSTGVGVGRVAGVPVVLQRSWFAFAALVVVAYGDVLGERGSNGYLAATAFVVLLLASVVLHEVGHCLVARAFGLPVTRISVSFLAGVTEITEAPQTPAREYAVAVSGPLASLLLGGLAAAAALLVEDAGTGELVLQLVAAANLVVGVLNLLPGLPLDGGRVLRAVVWRVTADPYRATVVSGRAGQALGLLVVPLLLAVVPLTGGEVTAVGVAFAALLGAFVHLGASAALADARLQRRLPGVRARDLARDALRVPADLPLAEAVRRAQEQGLRAVVVADGAGADAAVVSEARVHRVPPERRAWVAVSTVARPVPVIDADLEGEALVAALRRSPAGEYLVADPAGGPARVLAAEDVASALTA